MVRLSIVGVFDTPEIVRNGSALAADLHGKARAGSGDQAERWHEENYHGVPCMDSTIIHILL